jgi:hypothetical protein
VKKTNRTSKRWACSLFFKRNELRGQYEALLRTSQSRDTELTMLKERLHKADGLEETVRRQELVIEKLEAMITNYMKEKREVRRAE